MQQPTLQAVSRGCALFQGQRCIRAIRARFSLRSHSGRLDGGDASAFAPDAMQTLSLRIAKVRARPCLLEAACCSLVSTSATRLFLCVSAAARDLLGVRMPIRPNKALWSSSDGVAALHPHLTPPGAPTSLSSSRYLGFAFLALYLCACV